MIDATINESGDLVLTVAESDREEFRELCEKMDDIGALCEAMESYWANGSFQPFDAGAGNPFVGLTSAPCIAESLDCHDNGDMEIVGRFWWFPDYMIESPCATLAETGKVIFKAG